MANILNITRNPQFDERITKKEYHAYSPFVESFKNNDEIRISIQNQDLYILPSENFIYIEGELKKADGTVVPDYKLNNNCSAFLFDEIRYELNGVEIDRSRNVGITTSMKNYISLNGDESKMLLNAGWKPGSTILPTGGYFNFCIPLKTILGLAEDFKSVIVNSRHDLILIRVRTDKNTIFTNTDGYKLNVTKILWKVPHIRVVDN